MYGFGLILVLGLLGGMIAFLGDTIGKRIGRKRLTLFGLRPRHTSVVITVLTGIAIAAVSLFTLAAASSDVRTALFEMKEIQTALAQTHEALVASEEELEIVKDRLAAQRAEARSLERERRTAVAERDAAKAERNALAREMEEIAASLETSRRELDHWKTRVANLKDMGQTLEDSIAKLQSTEAKLRADLGALSEQYLAMEGRLRSGEFSYLKDEIVVAGVIEGGRPKEAVERELFALLEQADSLALARGARIEGKERAIELAKEEYFFQAVDVLAEASGPAVVRIVASQNSVEGEPLLVHFHVFAEARLYAAGEVIVERTLDGGRGDQEGLLLDLLQEANETVIEKGMLTSVGGDVGQLSGEQFVQALLELRKAGGRAKVQVVASEEIWNTRTPMEVDLRVIPAA